MATEWAYRDRLCNVSCSMCGSEPAEILKLTRALNVIVKDLGETSLSDPLLWQMLRGRNFSDRMIESAVKHVEDGIRMKCISRANKLKEKERKERERRAEQERLNRQLDMTQEEIGRDVFGHAASEDASRYALEGLQFGVDWAMQPGTTENVVAKMKSLGHDKFRRKENSPGEIVRCISLIKEKLLSIVKELGLDALDDPALVLTFQDNGADYNDYCEAARQIRREKETERMIDSLARSVNILAYTDNPWEYARKHPMSNGDMLFDTERQKSMVWSNGVLEELSNEPSPEVKRQVEQIEEIVGTYDRETAEKALREMNALEEMKPNGDSVIERLAGMGVTLTSPDESVNLLAERLENENPKKDEGRWRKKRIVKEAGHFENLRNTKYGQDGKKGSLWSRIKSAICGR